MKLLGDRLLLRAPAAPEKIGRIWVPPEAQREYTLCQAEIVGVGQKVRDARLQVGTHVICRRFGALELDWAKREWVVREAQIIAIVTS